MRYNGFFEEQDDFKGLCVNFRNMELPIASYPLGILTWSNSIPTCANQARERLLEPATTWKTMSSSNISAAEDQRAAD